jgi:hypothetical protein
MWGTCGRICFFRVIFLSTLGEMVMRRVSFLLIGFLALVPVAPGTAQTSNSSQKAASTAAGAAAGVSVPSMPKDPKDLMLLAAGVNGLGGADVKPWHLKANYQTFDADGKPKDQGVFEEWWVGPEKYKVSYSSASFNQTLYQNGDTKLITGDKGWIPTPEEMVRDI